MSGLITIMAGLLRTLFIRLPLGIWLGVIFAAAGMLLERQHQADFPILPCTTSWPPELVNPSYPDNPSGLNLLDPVVEHISALNLGVGKAELTFGRVEYGALLGILFGLLLCWPCGIWMTMRRYSGVLLFPFRIILLGLAYVALGGGLGYGLAHLAGAQLISTGYLALFGLAMPILVPLPFWVLRPFFPSAARRQANVLMRQARKEARTTLADIAKLDPGLGNVTKGSAQKEWDYYATVSGLFLGLLLGEKRGAPAHQRNSVERILRRKLNKQYEKGDPGLTAVSQFCKEYLEKGAKFTTEVLVGLWLAMQMKGGDLNPARDKDLAASLGSHIVQGMNRLWPARSKAGSFFAAVVLWAGVGGLAFLVMSPNQLEQQIAWVDDQLDQSKANSEEPVSVLEESPVSDPNAQSDSALDAVPMDDAETTDASREGPTAAETAGPSVPSELPKTANDESPSIPASDEKNNEVTLNSTTAAGPPANETSSADGSNESTAETEVKTDPNAAPNTKTNPDTESTANKVNPAMRQWSHVKGRKIQATAISYRPGAVELQLADGRAAFVELADLSPEDCRAVYEQFASEDPGEGNLLIHRWTAAISSKQVTAALVYAYPDSVQLLKADGRMINLPLEQLSAEDQAFAKAMITDSP